MRDFKSFGLTLERQAGMTLSSSPRIQLISSGNNLSSLPSESTLERRPRINAKPSKPERTPTAEQWQAHAGVVVNDALGILKMMSVPLLIFGLYRMAREGTITAGLAHVVPWPILETITHEEKHE